MTGGRRQDANHREIREACEAMGWLWIDTSQYARIGFDALLVRAGRIVPVEVKDGRKPLSRQKLTPNEQRAHADLQRHGVRVEILTGVDNGSLDVLTEPRRNMYEGAQL